MGEKKREAHRGHPWRKKGKVTSRESVVVPTACENYERDRGCHRECEKAYPGENDEDDTVVADAMLLA